LQTEYLVVRKKAVACNYDGVGGLREQISKDRSAFETGVSGIAISREYLGDLYEMDSALLPVSRMTQWEVDSCPLTRPGLGRAELRCCGNLTLHITHQRQKLQVLSHRGLSKKSVMVLSVDGCWRLSVAALADTG